VNASNIGSNFIAAASIYAGLITGANASFTNISVDVLNADIGEFSSNVDIAGDLTMFGSIYGTNIDAILIGSNEISAANLEATNSSLINVSATNISTTNITASGTIKGNIGSNLSAGVGINISTNISGITTITNTGLITSPLNVSIINASTGNIKILNSSTGNISINNVSVLLATSIAAPNGTIDNLECANHINTKTINCSVSLNASTVNASDVNASNIGSNFIAASSMYAGLITGANASFTNISVDILNISNISTNLIVTNNISSNNISCLTGGITTINSTTANISTINVSNANISNLSVKNNINCSGNIFTNSIYGTYIDSSNGYIGILNTGTITNTNLNSSNISTNTVNASILNGNISNNLIAGPGINISTNISGKTTISNVAQVSDPLNISTLNSSTVNASILNGNISNNLLAGQGISLNTLNNITTIEATGGLATSTQYCFQVYGNQGDYVINGGQTVPNNLIETCYPDFAHYNTSNYRYTVQVSGFYQMGFKIYFRNNAGTGPARFAIYKNEDLLGLGGQDVGTTETFTLIRYCNAGDYLTLRCFLGSLAIYQGLAHNWFYGYLLQPKNNTITESTALTITSLSTQLINSSTINNSTLNSSTINNSTSNISIINISTANISIIYTPTSNISTINNSTLNSSTINISTINNSTLNSSTINTSTLTTNGMTSTDLINGTDIILSSTLEVAGGVIAYQLRGDSLRIRSSNPVTYSDAIVNKFNNTVNFAGGSGLDPGSIQFSTNGINYDMVYDGNLNLINALNAGVVNAGFLNGNLSNNLVAGTNITLNTTIGGVTTISSSGSSSVPNFFYSSLLSNVNMGGTAFLLNPTTITSNCLNAGITYSGGVVGIQQDGYYRVSAQLNYYNGTTLRASGELAALLNNVELGNYPKGYSYARSGEGRSAGAGFSDWIVFLNNGDNVRFLFTVALATSGTFNGSLSGFVKLPGSYISVTKM